MILTPQESIIMKGRSHDDVITGLKRAIAVGALKPLHDSNGVILAVTDIGETVPAFNFPTLVRTDLGRTHLCIDLRKSAKEYKLDPMGNSFIPTLLSEANFQTNIALAQYVWMRNPSEFNNIYYDAARVYGMWVGMKIAKKLVLPPQHQTQAIVMATYFFLTRTIDSDYLTEEQYQFIISKISTLLGIQLEEVKYTIDATNRVVYEDIDIFANALNSIIDNPKLKSFNRVVLQSILIGSWFGGPNARELTIVAAEYPPIFLTMIYRGLTERSYKNSDITQLALKSMNTTKQQQYQLIFADMLKRAATTL